MSDNVATMSLLSASECHLAALQDEDGDTLVILSSFTLLPAKNSPLKERWSGLGWARMGLGGMGWARMGFRLRGLGWERKVERKKARSERDKEGRIKQRKERQEIN